MATYVSDTGAWAEVLEQSGKAWIASGGEWVEVRQIWAAEETEPLTYQWTRAWWAPDLPTGVSVDLEQVQFQGGDVEASWVNAVGTGDFGSHVEWEINGLSWGVVSRPPASSTATLAESELTHADAVRARMRYTYGGAVGSWGSWSDTLNYIGQ